MLGEVQAFELTLNHMIAFGIVGIMIIGAIIYALGASKNEAILKKRLNEINQTAYDSANGGKVEKRNMEDLSVSQKILGPYVIRISNFLKKYIPKEYINNLNERLILAGNPNGLTASEFIGFQGLFALVIPAGFGLFLLILGGQPSKILLFMLLFMCSGVLLPKFFLSKLITKRQEAIRKSLPFTLDLLNISVDAGLGFDSAMDKVAQTMDGEIAVEFSRCLSEIRLGKSRRDALKNMVERTNVTELNQFVVAIIQADKLGVGLNRLLRAQSKQMRKDAKQRAQEKAFKAPIKMLFPMILFIFPSIFIVLLGPAAFILKDVFGGM